MNDTIADLQSRLAFQEHTLDELNLVVARQRDELDRLRKEVELLRDLVRELNAPPVGDAGAEPPPPHY
jgi:SlyX protein